MPKKLPPGEGKRTPLNMRTTQELRDRLADASGKSGRSLSQEVELRLERSFEFSDLIERAIEKSTSMAFEEFKKLLQSQENYYKMNEEYLIGYAGGDDLFLFWSRLAFAIQVVEREAGKSIREDQKTREAAERAVLGAIPSLFRQMPEPYSVFRNRVASQPAENSPLALLGMNCLSEQSDDEK